MTPIDLDSFITVVLPWYHDGLYFHDEDARRLMGGRVFGATEEKDMVRETNLLHIYISHININKYNINIQYIHTIYPPLYNMPYTNKLIPSNNLLTPLNNLFTPC